MLFKFNILLLNWLRGIRIDLLAISLIVLNSLESSHYHDVIFFDGEGIQVAKLLRQVDLEVAP